jgi:hypothetical protein
MARHVAEELIPTRGEVQLEASIAADLAWFEKAHDIAVERFFVHRHPIRADRKRACRPDDDQFMRVGTLILHLEQASSWGCPFGGRDVEIGFGDLEGADPGRGPLSRGCAAGADKQDDRGYRKTGLGRHGSGPGPMEELHSLNIGGEASSLE